MKTITFDEAQWRLVPIEPTDEMILAFWLVWKGWGGDGGSDNRVCASYQEMIAAAPTPPAAGQQDDDLNLDRLADYIADNWPDKKYTLEEIAQRLHATWPAAFMPAQPEANKADAERTDFEEAWAAAGLKGLTAEALAKLRRGDSYANKYPILLGGWRGWQLARAARAKERT